MKPCYNARMNKPVAIKPPHILKLIKIGNSHGVILPREVLVKLGVDVGDMLDVVEKADGLSLRRHDGGFAEQMEVAREVMKRRRNALSELAK